MKTLGLLYENQSITDKSESDVFDYALNKVQQHGFTHFFFRTEPHQKGIYLDASIISNYPNEFIERYKSHCHAHKDPLVNHCQLSIEPIIWDDQVFQAVPELLETAQTSGLRYGWSQSVHDAKGAVSILSLSRDHTPLTQDEFNEKAADVLWLCNQLHSAMITKYLPCTSISNHICHLSIREVEVLKWTAEGKTASDIAMILSLTTRTVNFHISSAIRKMGACNKTSAVVIATKSGLL